MVDFSLSIEFIVVNDLFERYTIIVNTTHQYTSIYCEECDIFVEQYEGDHLSEHSADELYERIISDHKEQVLGTYVTIDDGKLL